MRYLRYLILGLVTFSLGVAISPIKFYVQGIGCGRVIDGGGGYSVTSYRSSYFVGLAFEHEGYVSAEKANDVFNEKLREAFTVLEITPKLNARGMSVSRRAVVIFFDREQNRYYASVFWTEGRFLQTISSHSYLHVKEFEKHNLGVYAQ